MQSNPITPKHLLSKRAVLKQIPISGATMWRTIAAGEFPKPIRIGKRRVAWLQTEIDDWLADRMEERAVRGCPTLPAPPPSRTGDAI
jgi:prophage regulatory protein